MKERLGTNVTQKITGVISQVKDATSLLTRVVFPSISTSDEYSETSKDLNLLGLIFL